MVRREWGDEVMRRVGSAFLGSIALGYFFAHFGEGEDKGYRLNT